jgi:hypothetical protein
MIDLTKAIGAVAASVAALTATPENRNALTQ